MSLQPYWLRFVELMLYPHLMLNFRNLFQIKRRKLAC